jgi:hypothetical protein
MNYRNYLLGARSAFSLYGSPIRERRGYETLLRATDGGFHADMAAIGRDFQSAITQINHDFPRVVQSDWTPPSLKG